MVRKKVVLEALADLWTALTRIQENTDDVRVIVACNDAQNKVRDGEAWSLLEPILVAQAREEAEV
jgi:hypothetical protein